MIPPKKHLLRHQPVNAQIGLMDGNTFCTTLEPRLFTIDLKVSSHKLVFTCGSRSTCGFGFALYYAEGFCQRVSAEQNITNSLYKALGLMKPCSHREQRPKNSNLWSDLTFKAIFKAKGQKSNFVRTLSITPRVIDHSITPRMITPSLQE